MKWNINDMPLFMAIVDSGSISSASRVLEVPKSTLSRSLNRLEDDLSVRLLQRNSRSMKLTEEGEAFYLHCQKMQEQIDATDSTITRLRQQPSDKLTVSMPAGFYLQFLQPIMSDFFDQHPQIKIDIMIAGWDQDLFSNSIDIAIQIGPLPDSDLVATKLIDSPLIWVVSDDYYQKNKADLTPKSLTTKKLKKHCKIMTDSRKHHALYIQHNNDMASLFTPPYNICNDSFAVKSAVCSGFGVSLIPKFIVEEELLNGSLKQIGKEYKIVPESSIYAVYPSKKYMAAKTKALLDFLKVSMVE